MKRARILLADDQSLLMEALTNVLEPEFEVVSIVADGRAVLKPALVLRPDVVVLDISMPLLNGLDAGRRIKANLPAIKLIYLTMNQDRDIVDEAFRIGATAYLLKDCRTSDLLGVIRRALDGWSNPSPFTTRSKSMRIASFRDVPARRIPMRLTPRQREVLQLLAEGRPMKEVAYLLEISPRTVAYHKYLIMENFGLHSTAELVRFALRKQVA